MVVYQLERVQRKFLKFVTFILNPICVPHENEPVLQRLILSTPCDKRKRGNLMFLSNLIIDEHDALALLLKVNFRVFRTFCSKYSFLFRIPFSHCNYLTNCPIIKIMKLTNDNNP